MNLITRTTKVLLGTVLATLSVAANANVITLDDISDFATVDCSAGALDPACLGFLGDGSAADPYAQSDSFARVYAGIAGSEAAETTFLNTLIVGTGGTAVDSSSATKIGLGGADSASFSTDAVYFSIKTGNGTAFFENLAGLITLDVVYEKFSGPDGAGGGISHATFWGGQTTTKVPEPATLSLLGAGLLAVGFAARRRRKTL